MNLAISFVPPAMNAEAHRSHSTLRRTGRCTAPRCLQRSQDHLVTILSRERDLKRTKHSSPLIIRVLSGRLRVPRQAAACAPPNRWAVGWAGMLSMPRHRANHRAFHRDTVSVCLPRGRSRCTLKMSQSHNGDSGKDSFGDFPRDLSWSR